MGGALPGCEPWHSRGKARLGDVGQAAEAVARRSYGKLVAFLAARSGDVAGAEDALSEAFMAALVDWPANGIPRTPEAWLLTVARRKWIDSARHQRIGADAESVLLLIGDEVEPEAPIPDERLRLMFACAHPAIDHGVRAPLILQTILGFDAAAIASAFLVAPSTMGQRLVRAKNKIKAARIPLRVPEREELGERLEAVLEAVYAAYSEGWSDPVGTESRRRNLAEEAIWLGQLVASLLPGEPEALGLLALMLYAESRRGARRDDLGEYIPLSEQDPKAWNHAMIDEAEALLRSASRFGATGRYQLEAAVQSAHVARRTGDQTDWGAIVGLYDALLALTASPVVALNRAIAIAEAQGPGAGIAAMDSLAADARLVEYQPYWAARAELLARAGVLEDADAAYTRAIGLESDPSVRRFLQSRQAKLVKPSPAQ